MPMRPIRTEDDHKAALARIDELWNAKPGSPEFDEAEALVVRRGRL